MFHKTSICVVGSLAVLAAANTIYSRGGAAPSQCNTSSPQCCKSTSNASDPATATLLGLLGIVVQGVDVVVGLGCTPIIGGINCAQQPVCCTSDYFNGLINIGCSPISL